MTNSVDPDQTAPIGAVCSGSTLFASILNLSVMLGNYLQQTTFSVAFFLGTLRVKISIHPSVHPSTIYIEVFICCEFCLFQDTLRLRDFDLYKLK